MSDIHSGNAAVSAEVTPAEVDTAPAVVQNTEVPPTEVETAPAVAPETEANPAEVENAPVAGTSASSSGAARTLRNRTVDVKLEVETQVQDRGQATVKKEGPKVYTAEERTCHGECHLFSFQQGFRILYCNNIAAITLQ